MLSVKLLANNWFITKLQIKIGLSAQAVWIQHMATIIPSSLIPKARERTWPPK